LNGLTADNVADYDILEYNIVLITIMGLQIFELKADWNSQFESAQNRM